MPLSQPAWWVPTLNLGFVAPCVMLAPFMGPLAGAFPKAPVTSATSALNVAGVLAMKRGAQPVLNLRLVVLVATTASLWMHVQQARRLVAADLCLSLMMPVIASARGMIAAGARCWRWPALLAAP